MTTRTTVGEQPDFDHEILDPEHAARLILERLNDAGFDVVVEKAGGRAMSGISEEAKVALANVRPLQPAPDGFFGK